MRYSILIESEPNALKLDKKMIGKKSSYMVIHNNHIIWPKSTIIRIDTAAKLEDGYGVYWFRMKGSLLSYLMAIKDYGGLRVKKDLIQD